jgi:hypothetical protein
MALPLPLLVFRRHPDLERSEGEESLYWFFALAFAVACFSPSSSSEAKDPCIGSCSCRCLSFCHSLWESASPFAAAVAVARPAPNL